MELKTGKGQATRYKKTDIGQLSNHVQWVKDNVEANEILPVFVGPKLTVSDSASPAPEMAVIELAKLRELGRRLVGALTEVSSAAIPITVETELAKKFEERELVFPHVLGSIQVTPLRMDGQSD